MLASAIQELNLNLSSLASTSAPLLTNTNEKTFLGRFYDRLTAWFADAKNDIGDFFANRIRTKTLCVGDSSNGETCITKSDLDRLLQNNSVGVSGSQSNSNQSDSTSPESNSTDSSTSSPQTSDTEAPVLTLVGNATSTLNIGVEYVDPGATVTDNVDNNLGVQTTGLVNTGVAGEYILYYDATDSAGNKANQLSRVITIVGPTSIQTIEEEVPVLDENASSTNETIAPQ